MNIIQLKSDIHLGLIEYNFLRVDKYFYYMTSDFLLSDWPKQH